MYFSEELFRQLLIKLKVFLLLLRIVELPVAVNGQIMKLPAFFSEKVTGFVICEMTTGKF